MNRTVLFLSFLMIVPGQAAVSACLSPDEARDAVTAQKLITIDQAARLARGKARGEMVSANLCRIDNRLVYDIAILSPGGRVARIGVDAATSTVKDLR